MYNDIRQAGWLHKLISDNIFIHTNTHTHTHTIIVTADNSHYYCTPIYEEGLQLGVYVYITLQISPVQTCYSQYRRHNLEHYMKT